MTYGRRFRNDIEPPRRHRAVLSTALFAGWALVVLPAAVFASAPPSTAPRSLPGGGFT